MTTPQLTVSGAGFRSLGFMDRVRTVLELDALSIVVIAIWSSVLVMSMRLLVLQDTFLALVDGRLIARHGLPHVDTLTSWTLGRTWTDQQWGAHLVLYELARHGGLRAVVLVGIGCVVAALIVAAVATRKLGASPSAAALGLCLPLICSPWLAQVRTQSLALVPFVAVYALLALDAQRPGRRVLWVLPLLAVWANLHGSVALAAGLTALYGVTLLRRPDARARALLLIVGAPLCVLASPYGLDLVAYYRMMLVSPPLAHFVQEWKPPAVSGATAPFFISAFVLTALWARHQRVLTSFERWALVILLMGALTAGRNAVWFELAAAASVPRLLDAVRTTKAPLASGVRRVNLLLGCVAVALASTFAVVQISRSTVSLEAGGPPAAAAAVAAAAGPHGIVLADDEHADWLLWEQPSLSGRVAYDVRFELFNGNELQQIVSLRHGARSSWRRCGVTASVVTFSSGSDQRQITQQGLLSRGAHPIVRTPGFTAVAQAPGAGACRL